MSDFQTLSKSKITLLTKLFCCTNWIIVTNSCDDVENLDSVIDISNWTWAENSQKIVKMSVTALCLIKCVAENDNKVIEHIWW